MTDTTLTPTAASAADILRQAAQALQHRFHPAAAPPPRPTPDAVREALLATERTTKRQRRTLPFEDLHGEWRLGFTTGVQQRKAGGIRLRSGFYLPAFIPASISFFPAAGNATDASETGTIRNQIGLVGLHLKLDGPCRYSGKQNLVAFDLTTLEIRLFGLPLYRGALPGRAAADDFADRPIAQLPFFAFFAATPDYIAARGRGGGLALWVKLPGSDSSTTTAA